MSIMRTNRVAIEAVGFRAFSTLDHTGQEVVCRR